MVRIWNPREEMQNGKIDLATGFRDVEHVDFSEDGLDSSEIQLKKNSNKQVQFAVKAKTIITLLFKDVLR